MLRPLKSSNVCMKTLVAEPRDNSIRRLMEIIRNETSFTIFGDYVSEII